MFTDAGYHQHQLKHSGNVTYNVVDVDGVNETAMVNLTDWQLAALSGLNSIGRSCLIESWMNSSFSRKSCCTSIVSDMMRRRWSSTSLHSSVSR